MEAPSQEILDARAKLATRFGGNVRTGGKGTSRRTKKVVHKNASADDAKLQLTLKKVGCQEYNEIQEVNMFRRQGKVMHFNKCKVLISPYYNTVAIMGKPEEKDLAELMPGIINQLGYAHLFNDPNFLKAAQEAQAAENSAANGDEDVPDLVENFEEVSKDE